MSKVKDAEAETALLHYLIKENRPYSAVDIFNNLHREYGKTAVTRALENLAQEGKIKEKVYGKQKVYLADQSHFADVDETELKEMDAEIVELAQKLKSTQAIVRSQEEEIRSLESSLTTNEAVSQLTELTKECDVLQQRLSQMKSAENVVSPEEKEKIYKQNKKLLQEWRKRKRMAMNILNAVLENYPNTKKELYEEIGIETDEDYGVTFPV